MRQHSAPLPCRRRALYHSKSLSTTAGSSDSVKHQAGFFPCGGDWDSEMSIDIETRRRRAAYRAAHRGTREMDWLMGKYAEQALPEMDEAALTRFEAFLSLPDTELQKWIMTPTMLVETEFADLIDVLREFHKVSQRE